MPLVPGSQQIAPRSMHVETRERGRTQSVRVDLALRSVRWIVQLKLEDLPTPIIYGQSPFGTDDVSGLAENLLKAIRCLLGQCIAIRPLLHAVGVVDVNCRLRLDSSVDILSRLAAGMVGQSVGVDNIADTLHPR